MALLYPEEHFSCHNYEKGKDSTLLVLEHQAGEIIDKELHDTEILFILRGKLSLSCGKIRNNEVGDSKMMLFPPGCQLHIEVQEETLFVICRIRGIFQLCECMPLEHIYSSDMKRENSSPCDAFHILDINAKLHTFFDFLLECTNDGLKCTYYFETKIKELFFLLRAYYTKQELRHFFFSLLSSDSKFMNLMYRNYRKVKNVRELADISLYSESGFKKQFARVFGTSASDWLRRQKASLIFHDLNCSAASIKELSDKYDFSSVSSFTTFCQQVFNKTPGQIRANKSD